MKNCAIILFLIFMINPARADYIATQTFVIDANSTISVNMSGNLSSAINADKGTLANGLNINFSFLSNTNYNNATLKAFVVDSSNVKHSAFSGIDHGYTQSENVYIEMTNDTSRPTPDAVIDCKSTTSSYLNNANVIAYPGTVTIDGNGKLRYRNNGDSDFLELQFVANETTNVSLSLSTDPKPGTFDVETSLDEPGPYLVEIYVDNLP